MANSNAGIAKLKSRTRLRFKLRELITVLAVTIPFAPAQAMDIEMRGDSVVMSGHVVGHECETLRQILDAHTIGTVVLTNSGGGNANAGYCVGELIRERGLKTTIRGRCASSCSRMWLGGVRRTLEGGNSRVGLHGNYNNGALRPDAAERLRAWIPRFAPVDRNLMEQWINLPSNKQMMYFYNDRVELCESRSCTPIPGRNARNAGLTN